MQSLKKTRLRPGICSSYLQDAPEGAEIFCAIKPAAMEAPLLTDSLLCAGIGSGVAPLLGYLYDRVAAAERGENVGEFLLYFGNRFDDKEFLYRNDFAALEEKYTWFTLRTAFSNLGRVEESELARTYPNWFTFGIHDYLRKQVEEKLASQEEGASEEGASQKSIKKDYYVQHVVESDTKVRAKSWHKVSIDFVAQETSYMSCCIIMLRISSMPWAGCARIPFV